MRWAAVLLGLAACGRLHFDDLADGQAPRDAGPVGSIGCADGEREGFDDTVRFPQIAACAATWAGTSSTLCTAGVFPTPNTLAGADMQGCGALAGTTQTGVLCCAD